MSGKDKEREERLAAALRENLRRRKAQARELDSSIELAPLMARAAETTFLQKAAGRWKQWFRR